MDRNRDAELNPRLPSVVPRIESSRRSWSASSAHRERRLGWRAGSPGAPLDSAADRCRPAQRWAASIPTPPLASLHPTSLFVYSRMSYGGHTKTTNGSTELLGIHPAFARAQLAKKPVVGEQRPFSAFQRRRADHTSPRLLDHAPRRVSCSHDRADGLRCAHTLTLPAESSQAHSRSALSLCSLMESMVTSTMLPFTHVLARLLPKGARRSSGERCTVNSRVGRVG